MTTGEVLRVRAAMKPIATVPARAAHGRRRHRRGGRRPPPALRRLRRAGRRHRRRGDGRAGAGRRGAGEVRRRLGRRDPAQRRELPGHAEVHGDAAMTRPRVVLVGPMGAGKTTVGRLLAERWGVGFRDTDARHRGGEGRQRLRHLRRRRRGSTSASWSAAAVADALAEHDGVLALGGGAVLDPGDPRAARPATASSSCGSGSPTPSSGSGSARPGRCCSATSAAGSSSCSTSAPRSTRRSPTHVVDTDGRDARRGRRPRSRRSRGWRAGVSRPGCTSAARRRTTSWSGSGARSTRLPGDARRRRAAGSPSSSPDDAAQPGRPGARRRSAAATTCSSSPLPDGEAAKTADVAARLLGGARPGRLHPLRRRRHRRRRSDHRPRRVRRRHLAARRARRARADDAARHGRRRRRRQDRHQHRRRQEPRRLLPRAGRRALRPRPARARCPRAELVAGLGEVVKCGFIADPRDPRAGRGRPAPAARPGVRRAARAGRARRPGQGRRRGRRPASETGGSGRATRAARCSTTATRWRTRSSGRRTTASGTARRSRSAWCSSPSWPGWPAGSTTTTAARHAAALAPVGLPTRYGGAPFDELLATMRVDKKARGDAAALRGARRARAARRCSSGPDEALLRAAYDVMAEG